MKKGRELRVPSELVSRIASAGLAALLIIDCAVTLSACSIPIADIPLIGLPANAPPRSETPPAYLPVHDVPPPRDDAVLTADQQKALQSELLTARDKQSAQANALVKGTPAGATANVSK